MKPVGRDSRLTRYVLEELDGVTVIRLQRQLSLPDLFAVVQEVARRSGSDRRLWDVGEYFHFSAVEIKRIAELGRRLWPAPARVAYVGSGAVFYGLLRMFEAYRDQKRLCNPRLP